MSSPRKDQKKTILQVVPSLISGGVERGTIEIAKKLKQIGFNSMVISAGGPMVAILKEFEITHIKLNVSSKNPLIIWKNARLIADIIKKHNVDIIHARSRAPAWSCSIAAKATNIKFITTFHGIYNISGFFKKYYNSIMARGQRIIAVSNFVKQHILDNYNPKIENIRVIHRGVDHLEFNPDNISQEYLAKFVEKYNVNSKNPIILLPSRMTSWKGHLVLIEALSKIRDLDFLCFMVGDLSKHPNFVKIVKSRILELRLQGKIQIFGNEPNMQALYAMSDIVLSTSTEPEAFGRVIIEGQSMKKIVIATNIGGASETIEHKKTGFHIKPNDPEELSELIKYSLQNINSPAFDKIRDQARKSVIENFSLDNMLTKTIKVYKELL